MTIETVLVMGSEWISKKAANLIYLYPVSVTLSKLSLIE